jgi:uncharacterized protein
MPTVRFTDSIDAVAAADWDALRPDDNPFLSHAFLAGLERHGCLQSRLGWRPHHLLLHEGPRLLAAAPGYLKGNSHGEFVFDHRWAEAYARHGLAYYPKLLCAVPYSPVPGPRLLCGPGDEPTLRRALLQALEEETARLGLSSAHLNFDDRPAPGLPGWLPRHDWQFHWHDRGFGDFDGFLAALNAKKRKNIRQERRQVADAGVRFRVLHGDEATEADLARMHGFYVASFIGKGNLPVLTLEFLRHLAASLPRQLLLVLAERGGATIAGALLLRSADTLYGRYWGCREPLPGLHFETCYYQGIEYCLRHGLARFEPGAQGEHKLARGFMPVRTHSLHHFADPRFAAAVAASLAEEASWLSSYHEALMRHSPYRADD